MAKLRYEVKAKTGTYTDRSGNEKTAYSKIGVVLQGDKGFILKLETVPVNWDGWAYLNEPQPKQAPRDPLDDDDRTPP